MYPKLYATRMAAQAELDVMRGWDAVIVKVDRNYLIQCYELETGRCGQAAWMCEDGYVR